MILICEDAETALPKIKSASCDACITDPPYGDTNLPWDYIVNGWILEIARILKPNASIWVFGSIRFLAPLFAQMSEHGFKYSQDIVWEKQNGTGFHADRFRRVHEHAVLFYRGKWRDVTHETQYTMDAVKKQVRRKKRPAHCGNVGESHYVSEDGGPKMMRSVIKVRNEHGRAIHPTQKPEEIISSLIKYSTKPGDKIIDPFMGSGTTGLCSGLLDRDFIGMENDKVMFAKAENRLNNALGLDLA